MPVDTADDELKAGALWGRVKKGIAGQKGKATRELGVRAKEIWEELDGRGWGWTKEEFYAFADAHCKNRTTDDARLAGMRLDAAESTPRQICACFPRMLLGLDYLTPRAADNYEPRRACCKSWIAYRDAQRADPPADKPDVESLPPDTAEGQWRKWLAEPDALPNLDLKEDELWIAVGYLQLKGETATAKVQGRPSQGRIGHSCTNATCSPCEKDGYSKEGKEKLKEATMGPQRCPAFVLLPDANHSGSGHFPTGQYRKEGKGPVLFTWSGRCCKKGCADAVAKALYQHEHENVPYPEGFTPPTS